MNVNSYWEMSGAIPISGKLRHWLDQERGVSFARASGLRMVARQRQEGGRATTDFRVFDPASLDDTADELIGYDSLASEAILYDGCIESDGTIVLNPRTVLDPLRG